MPVICSICQEPLVYTGSDPSADKDSLALTCGHIQHRGCLQKWFSSKPSRPPGFAPCPMCKIINSIEKATQVYPTLDDDDLLSQFTAAQERINHLTTQNVKFDAENSKLKSENKLQVATTELIQKHRNEIVLKYSKLLLENGILTEKNQKLQAENSKLKNSHEEIRLTKIIPKRKGTAQPANDENHQMILRNKIKKRNEKKDESEEFEDLTDKKQL